MKNYITEIQNLSVGEEITIADEDHIIAVAEKVSADIVIYSQTDPNSNKEVLRIHYNLKTDGSNIQFVDRDFYTITVDGMPVGPGSGSAQGDIEWDPKTRILNISTK